MSNNVSKTSALGRGSLEQLPARGFSCTARTEVRNLHSGLERLRMSRVFFVVVVVLVRFGIYHTPSNMRHCQMLTAPLLYVPLRKKKLSIMSPL